MRISEFPYFRLIAKVFNPRICGLILLITAFFSACERTQFLPSISTDEDPVISIINPTTNNTLARVGEQVRVGVLAVDDLALTAFRLKLKVVDDSGNILEENTLIQQELQDLRFSYELAEVIPQEYASTQLIYTFEAIDSKGAKASVDFSIGVVKPELPPEFRILSFSDQSLSSKLAGTNYALNFTSRATYPPPASNALSRDIEENTLANANGDFSAKLVSPSNSTLGQDSVFVMTNTSRFNFDEATWLGISQAYFSAGEFLAETPSLQVDDLVIVRLTKAPATQFAIMKIREVIDEAGTANDRIIFDYKVSSE